MMRAIKGVVMRLDASNAWVDLFMGLTSPILSREVSFNCRASFSSGESRDKMLVNERTELILNSYQVLSWKYRSMQ